MVTKEDKQLKCRTDDIFLLSFLRARKYDKGRALKLLKNYYLTRKKYPNIYKNLNPSAIETVLQKNTMCITHLETGNIVLFARYSHWDPTQVKLIDLLRCGLLFADLELNDHPVQVNGIDLLIDAKTLAWGHLIQYTPSAIYCLVSCLCQSLPLSYKSVHIVNVNKLVYVIMGMIVLFLPYKLRQRIHYYGSNMENLHKSINPKYLPAEFGGKLPSFDGSECNQKLRDKEEFFIENEKYWTEEEKNN